MHARICTSLMHTHTHTHTRHSQRPQGKGAYYGTFSKWENKKTTDSYDKRPLTKGEQTFAPVVCVFVV